MIVEWLLQVSLRESKDGSEAKVEASKTFSRVIAAGLHRIASAMAKDSDCITKASKVSSCHCVAVGTACLSGTLSMQIVPCDIDRCKLSNLPGQLVICVVELDISAGMLVMFAMQQHF